MLQASRDKNGVYIEPWRFDQMENTLASQGNQVPPPPRTDRHNYVEERPCGMSSVVHTMPVVGDMTCYVRAFLINSK